MGVQPETETGTAATVSADVPEEGTYRFTAMEAKWPQVWEDLSKVEATLKLPPQDVPGRLRAMEQYLFQRVDIHVLLSRAMTRQCQRGAFAALKAAIKEAQEDLADHFAICIHTS